MHRDIRHVAWVAAVVIPAAAIATLLTSEPPPPLPHAFSVINAHGTITLTDAQRLTGRASGTVLVSNGDTPLRATVTGATKRSSRTPNQMQFGGNRTAFTIQAAEKVLIRGSAITLNGTTSGIVTLRGDGDHTRDDDGTFHLAGRAITILDSTIAIPGSPSPSR